MIEKYYFDTTPDGKEVFSYLLKNAEGTSVRILDFGGTVQELKVKDRFGRMTDVVSGYDSIADYVKSTAYYGALIGRYGNRIDKGQFTLDGKTYSVSINNGENSLHGGKVGFSHRVWDAVPKDGDEPTLVLSLISPDGEEGFPGTLRVEVTYTLTRDNALSVSYEATTDKKTIVNLTNHTYFNLGGYASGSILDHVLRIDADRYLRTREGLIPTGEIVPVDGTPFNFRTAKPIGRDLDENHPDVKVAGGYDHCFCFTGGASEEPVLRAELYDPKSGRNLEVFTDQPCIQLYIGNFMAEQPELPQKGGFPATKRTALALETQKMPDSPNHPNFTDTTLNPGEVYKHRCVYRFSVK